MAVEVRSLGIFKAKIDRFLISNSVKGMRMGLRGKDGSALIESIGRTA